MADYVFSRRGAAFYSAYVYQVSTMYTLNKRNETGILFTNFSYYYDMAQDAAFKIYTF